MQALSRFEVRLASATTRLCVGPGALGELPGIVAGRRVVLVADRRVFRLHGSLVSDLVGSARIGNLLLPPGEAAKTPAWLARGWSRLAELGVRRSDWLLALGGGAALDVAGLLASTWMRGVSWLALPTTLVGQADACLGGKTAVNLAQGKNLVGTFHPASFVIADPRFPASEPERDYLAARFELLKCAWLGDRELGRLAVGRALAGREPAALARAVERALRLKARLVSQDERDQGVRQLLNLGHTFGHALEAESGFRALRHAEAVGLGLLAAARVSERLGLIGAPCLLRMRGELAALGLASVAQRLAPTSVRKALRHARLDKKRAASDGLSLVLPTARGAILRSGLPVELFAWALEAALAECRGADQALR